MRALLALPELQDFFKSRNSAYLFCNLLRQYLSEKGITIRRFDYTGGLGRDEARWTDFPAFSFKKFDSRDFAGEPVAGFYSGKKLFILERGDLRTYLLLEYDTLRVARTVGESAEMILDKFGQHEIGRLTAEINWRQYPATLGRPDRPFPISAELSAIVIPEVNTTLRFCVDLYIASRAAIELPDGDERYARFFEGRDMHERRELKRMHRINDPLEYVQDFLAKRNAIVKEVYDATVYTRDRRPADDMTIPEYRKQQALDIYFKNRLEDLRAVGIDTDRILRVLDNLGRSEAGRATRECTII